jgi:hypothetical protein
MFCESSPKAKYRRKQNAASGKTSTENAKDISAELQELAGRLFTAGTKLGD